MTTTPDSSPPPADEGKDIERDSGQVRAVGAEISMSEGEGSTFEPEEDPGA